MLLGLPTPREILPPHFPPLSPLPSPSSPLPPAHPMAHPVEDPFAPGGAADDLLGDVDLLAGAPPADPAPADAPDAPSGDVFPPARAPPAAAAPAQASAAAFEVTVSDPEKKGEGVYAFVTYKVNTKALAASSGLQQSSVVRRYRDFHWLHAALQQAYPGFLVPPLPEKAIIGRFSPMFVDSRRRGLELFLNRLAQHRALKDSPDLRLFLHGGQEFVDRREGGAAPAAEAGAGGAAGAPAAEEESAAASAAKGLFSYFSEAVQTVSNTWGAGKEREKSADDLKCDGIDAYAATLEAGAGNVHKNIETLTGRTKALSSAWFEFGFACTLFGQYETEQEEQQMGAAFAKLGNCADRLSVLLTQQVDTQVIHFQEPFLDFLRLVGAVKAMLKARAAALLTYQTSLSALESKQAQLLKYQGRPGKEDRALAAERDVADLQRRVDRDLEQLQTVTARVFEETERFRREKRLNFKNAMLDFVRMQVEHARKVQQAWESVLPELEALPFEE